jgi:hypothetical protein
VIDAQENKNSVAIRQVSNQFSHLIGKNFADGGLCLN